MLNETLNKRLKTGGMTIKVISKLELLADLLEFIKGVTTTDKLWMNDLRETIDQTLEESSNEFELNESNCDDPELLELVRCEVENS